MAVPAANAGWRAVRVPGMAGTRRGISAGGTGVVDAVGANCAVPGVWPPVTIGDRRFMDGGVRSVANADLAAGYERVVIVAPVAQGTGPLMPSPGDPGVAAGAGG